MTNEKLTELLKIAYRWGRENGSNRSDKNFNDLIQTKAISQALRIHDVVGQSEQFISLIRELIDVGIIDEDDIEVETWVNNYLKEIN